jgi:endoglucanase
MGQVIAVVIRSSCSGNIESLAGYDISNQTAYLDDMLRWSLGWLIKVGLLIYTLVARAPEPISLRRIHLPISCLSN